MLKQTGLFAALISAVALAQPKPIANYAIDAQLDAAQKLVSGRETIDWLNDSGDEVGELRFHLYMNAFRNSKSTFIRESGGQLRGDRSKRDNWGWVEIEKLEAAGSDLTRAIEFIHPDDDNADDRTVIRVPLASPVKPGGRLTIQIAFKTKFPEVYARTGYHGDFFLGGQWFPKLGVYERMGMRYADAKGAWNCHQFHANSEFYADFGSYHVNLTVPAGYVVGATGVERGRKENGSTVTYRYEQDNVHDFAWTAQPGYLKLERTFSADSEVKATELAEITRLLGITHEDARLGDVKMILLLQPEHRAQADRHFRALAAGIKWFGLWYGRYPYQTITLVDPPRGAGGAGGMEYPTFITGGTTWLAGYNDDVPEEVVVHEFGHQFWQGMVATNEFEEAWMDEGFNTYSTGKVLDKVYGRRNLPIQLAGIPATWFMATPQMSSLEMNRAVYFLAPDLDNLARPAWRYSNSSSYGVNSYYRTGLMLTMLENLLGAETMARAMRTYHQRWRYGHPAAPDFTRAIEEVSGRQLKWFFDQYIYGSNLIDYAIASFESEPERTGAGVFGDGAARKTVTEADAERQDEKLSKDKTQQFLTRITVAREGGATFPVDIVVRFENGETETRQWDGEYRWAKFEFLKASRAISAEVDPQRKAAQDVNWSNNSYTRKPQFREPVKLGSQLLFWIQNLLLALSSFA